MHLMTWGSKEAIMTYLCLIVCPYIPAELQVLNKHLSKSANVYSEPSASIKKRELERFKDWDIGYLPGSPSK
uniref:Ovule protein n=1 Tax=Heterorhabditis bacteriophora TaxID=37862 RepID=A0A1I7X3E9_HETBA